MKSQDRWDFAQTYSALEIIKLGGLLIVSSLIGIVIPKEQGAETAIGLGLVILAAVILIIRTEKAIKSEGERELNNN